MFQNGFIPFNRNDKDLDIYPRDRIFTEWEAYCDLLFSVNYSQNFKRVLGKTFKIEAGEMIISLRFLAKRWSWSKSKIQNFLKYLTRFNLIEIKATNEDSKKSKFGQIIRVISINGFSEKGQIQGQQKDSKETVKVQQKDKGEESNNNNNNNIYSLSSKDEAPAKEFSDFYLKITDCFNTVLKGILPKCSVLTKKRISNLKARILENKTERSELSWWENYFEIIKKSDFLCGRKNKIDFLASFDWIINPSNMVKILEGNYDEKQIDDGLPF
jgi:hypothetical protein